VARRSATPPFVGGLGFGFKWNMGWMHDTLAILRTSRSTAVAPQRDLTFSMLYAFSENFVLPISHDEVVHGKGSACSPRWPATSWQKLANLPRLLAFMWATRARNCSSWDREFAQSIPPLAMVVLKPER
jgi:1,4-alpha-glucan branching enzyme